MRLWWRFRPSPPNRGKPTAVDLFAGAGGATQGLRDAGFDVAGAIENDPAAAATWRLNHPGTLLEEDVATVEPARLLSLLGLEAGELTLLKACPPCQGFSSLRGRAAPDDSRNDLVLDTLRFVDGLQPRAVLLENVPGLADDHRFASLTERLKERGYEVRHYIVDAALFGVPQRRRRLVVVAIRQAVRPLPDDLACLLPVGLTANRVTAGEALGALAGQLRDDDPVHRWRQSSATVARRIRAVPVGGTRFDLPEDLRLQCHERLTNERGMKIRAATGSYGRVRANEPAPTMTTRCTTPACGPFIHPTEHRGLSLREAAALQSFPADYRWSGGHDAIERQIGNAVPVLMARALGLAVLAALGADADGGIEIAREARDPSV